MKKDKLIYIFLAFFSVGLAVTSNEDISRQALSNYEQQYATIVNNVVNANTPGFKSSRAITSVSGEELQTELVPNPGRGSLVFSGNQFHVGIDGPGYFAVESPEGIYYTRDGRFQLNNEFQLVTLSGGFKVYGESGPISLAPDESGGLKFTISEEGLIVQKENVVDRLLIGNISDIGTLDIVNGAFFKQKITKKKEGSANDQLVIDSSIFEVMENFIVRQGYYEASNVDMAKELVNLPMVAKKFDANSKVLQIKGKIRKSALEMGRPQ